MYATSGNTYCGAKTSEATEWKREFLVVPTELQGFVGVCSCVYSKRKKSLKKKKNKGKIFG